MKQLILSVCVTHIENIVEPVSVDLTANLACTNLVWTQLQDWRIHYCRSCDKTYEVIKARLEDQSQICKGSRIIKKTFKVI